MPELEDRIVAHHVAEDQLRFEFDELFPGGGSGAARRDFGVDADAPEFGRQVEVVVLVEQLRSGRDVVVDVGRVARHGARSAVEPRRAGRVGRASRTQPMR